MEKNEKKRSNNPRQGASPLSIITFTWLSDIFRKGFKRDLEVSDLYSALDEHSSCLLGNKLSQLWQEEQEHCQKLNNKSTPSLARVLLRCFGCDLMKFGICLAVLEFVVRTSQPIILANLLKYFNGVNNMDQLIGIYWGSALMIGVFLDGFVDHLFCQGLMHIGMKIRVACCSHIYRKIMRISKVAIEDATSVGQMINLLSNDVNRLDYSVFFIHYIWIAPLQTALISYLLYREIGLAAIGGLLILLLFIGVHGCYGKLTSYFTLKFAYRTDERLRLTNEIINGVKVIKMYAWEKPFSSLMDKARMKEVKVIRNNSMLHEIIWSLESYIPRICIFVTVLAHVLFGNKIEAEQIFLVIAYYNILRATLYRVFPLSIKELAEALVSIKRLQKFLFIDELQHQLKVNNQEKSGMNNVDSLILKNVSVKWTSESKLYALKNLNFNIKPKSLTAIVGQVGSGKTTLFYTMLKEISAIQGEIKINGQISYSSQEPWIFASTIRQNILFGKEMIKERYEKVIEVCQLRQDFQLLPYGDNTLTGARGINLSGGQCARINLARAVYHEADIYLLDDPLSAVDTQVGKGIFENCIKTFLKDKTVLVITHQLHYLKNVDRIIVFDNGAIVSDGTYTELINSGLQFSKILQLASESDEIVNHTQMPVKEKSLVAESATFNREEKEQEESRTLGNIKGKTYLQYFDAARSIILVITVFLVSALSQIAASSSDYFITYWVNTEELNTNVSETYKDDPFQGRSWFIYVYASITISNVFVTLLQAYTFFNMCMRISHNLHASMFRSIIETSMAFFNANPVGRIMNRFSKDMGIIDARIPESIINITQIALYAIAVIGIVASVNPWLIIPAAILGFISYSLRMFYIRTSRSIKRLEGITRSPVFNHISASVQGITIIRALHAQNILIKEFDDHQDLHSSAWFTFFSGSRALGIYISLLCTIFTGIVTYTLVLLKEVLLAGDVGLVLTQCILLTGMLHWGIRQTTELENQMTSVERVLEYSKLPKETNLKIIPETKASENWPMKGQIIFKNVNLTYDRQERPALKNLDFTIEPKQMIGIVGRTGAGKSSIINAIFRLADFNGEIYIDNISTASITLEKLRSKISIIPQEPVLFAGNLRRNLDPFNEYTDLDLWKALEDVELKPFLESDLGLNMKVMEGGSNFSVGQRQLLCLARAIVRNNKILLIDEATANVDAQTDNIIQKAIRRKFENCTVIVIAHRLNTVIDSDKIIVMDAGQAVEFDHPYILLQREGGIFSNMVQQVGSKMADNFLTIAKSSYDRNKLH